MCSLINRLKILIFQHQLCLLIILLFPYRFLVTRNAFDGSSHARFKIHFQLIHGSRYQKYCNFLVYNADKTFIVVLFF